jgi:hypothetical protein
MADVSITTQLEGASQVEAGLRRIGSQIKAELGNATKTSSALTKEMSSLQNGLRGVSSELTRFTPAPINNVVAALGGIGGAAGIAATGVGLLTAAFASMFIKLGNTVEQLDNTAARLLITTEQVQQLQFVASQSGLSFGSMETAIFMLNRQIASAAEGNKQLSAEFARMGIQIRDSTTGELRPAFEVLLDIDDKLSNLQGPEKALTAMRLMGRGASQVLPALNGQLRETIELAPVMGEALLEAGRNADQSVDKLSASWQAFKIELLTGMIPAINAVAIALGNIGGGINPAMEASKQLNKVNTELRIAEKQLSLMKKGSIFDIFNDYGSLEKRIKDLRTLRNTLIEAEVKRIQTPPSGTAAAQGRTVPIVPVLKTGGAGADPLAPLKSMREELQRSIATFGMGADAVKRWNLEHGELSRISGRNAAALRAENMALLSTLTAKEQAKKLSEDQAEADKHLLETQNEITRQNIEYTDSMKAMASELEDAADPMRAYSRELERIHAVSEEMAKQGTPISSQALAQAFEDAKKLIKTDLDEMTEFTKQAARNMQDAMSTFFFDALQGKMGNLADSFKRTIDKMVADLLASKLNNFLFGDFGKTGNIGGFIGGSSAPNFLKNLFGGATSSAASSMFSGSSLGFGGNLAAGIGFPSLAFQTGGSFDVGGVGGPDSQLVAFKATPGERVQVGQPKDMGGAVNFNFNIQTPDADSFRRSQGQMIADAAAALQRARRNL